MSAPKTLALTLTPDSEGEYRVTIHQDGGGTADLSASNALATLAILFNDGDPAMAAVDLGFASEHCTSIQAQYVAAAAAEVD